GGEMPAAWRIFASDRRLGDTDDMDISHVFSRCGRRSVLLLRMGDAAGYSEARILTNPLPALDLDLGPAPLAERPGRLSVALLRCRPPGSSVRSISGPGSYVGFTQKIIAAMVAGIIVGALLGAFGSGTVIVDDWLVNGL